MHSSADTALLVRQNLLPAMAFFKRIVTQMKLKLSPKAALVTSSKHLDRTLHRELANIGLKFVLSRHARDLGITMSGGKARPCNLQLKRQNKSKIRIDKTRLIAKISFKARKLFTGSGFASSTWGHQASGLAESKISELESDALACSGIKAAGRCKTIALIVAFGVQGTPRARIVRETIRAYFEMIRSATSDEIKDIRSAWPIARDHLISKKVNAMHIIGLMSNVIYILLHAKWNPRAFNCWEDPENSKWIIQSWAVSPDIVAAAISNSYFSNCLKSASLHHNGKGIENGVDVINTLRHPRSIKDNTQCTQQYKAAMETVLVAGCWPAVRIASISPTYSKVCQRCGQADEDDLHTFWTCPHNANNQHENVSQTQYLIPRAKLGSTTHPCMWLRGILPSSFTQLPVEHASPLDVLVSVLHQPENMLWDSGTYYGDASGGENTSFKELRRVGVAAVRVDLSGNVLYAISSNLPGPIQTVGRGELFAALLVVRHLKELSLIHIPSPRD